MKDYINKWESSDLYCFEPEIRLPLSMTKEDIAFLKKVGLPKDAAPYLSFGGEHSLKLLPEIYERSSDHSKIYIGSDDEGSPICIDQLMNNSIVVCDHDNDFKPQYINSSLITIFKSLTLFKSFIDMLVSKRGEDAFLDLNFTEEEFQKLKTDLSDIDAVTLNEGCFWRMELDCMWDEKTL